MKSSFLVLLLALALSCPQAAESVTSYKSTDSSTPNTSIELMDAIGSVYGNGEAVRFTVRSDQDAYFLVFNIDTDGFVHLLYPHNSNSLRRISSGDVLVIPEKADESLLVTGQTGMEFVFAIAVPDKDLISQREMDWLYDDPKQPVSERFRVTGDPFLAANRIASRLVRGIAYSRDVSLSYTYFFVNEAVDYPRYICEDCYETRRDPYEPDLAWIGTSALNQTSGLAYPLTRGFQLARAEEAGSLVAEELVRAADGQAEVQYYPTFEGRDYDNTVRVAVTVGYPLYTGWTYYPYYYPYWGSGWYFSVGWGWGWNYPAWGWGWGWHRPYYYGGWGYYCSPYYGHHYWGGYYASPYRYKHGGRSYYSVAERSFRPTTPGRRYKSDGAASYAALSTRSREVARSYGSPRYSAKSRSSYTPRRTYAGKSSSPYTRYASKPRSSYKPRTSYGKYATHRSYSSGGKTLYRPRSSGTYRPTYNNRSRSTKSRSYSTRSYRGKVSTGMKDIRTRAFGSGTTKSKSFTRSRSSGASRSKSSAPRTRSSSRGSRSKSR